MKQSKAWLLQSASDFRAIARIFDETDPGTYCQSIAKCQQTVEKVVKALVSALDEAGLASYEIGCKHEVDRFVSSFDRIRHQDRRHRQDVFEKIFDLFNARGIRKGIKDLDGLVPKCPPRGQPLQRNTEYPFHAPDSSYCAPADKNAFDLKEVEQFQKVAKQVYIGCDKIIKALELSPTTRHGRRG